MHLRLFDIVNDRVLLWFSEDFLKEISAEIKPVAQGACLIGWEVLEPRGSIG